MRSIRSSRRLRRAGRMSNLIKTDESYRNWVSEISKEFRRSQIKAATHVNAEMLMFFWRLGRDIHAMMEKNIYGSAFFNNLSKDLKDVMPDIKSFSVTNLHYMVWFYELYPDALNLPQPGVNSESKSNLPQAGEDSEKPVFRIPWGHNKLIIDKCKGNPDKAEFYAEKTLENNWSRVVLLNFLGTDLYERQGKAVTNFALTLPKPQSDLAQEITRDPYNFDFLTIRETYDEKELKDALMDNIEKFLLELGNGFAFVGREVRLEMGETENFMDMLFYNIKLHCYVVVEVKVREFESSDMGQLGTYMVAVNHQMKGEIDGPTLGLLICKSKDNVKAKYALEASSQPMGISEYDISTFLPDKYKSSLPTIEEIEAELTDGPINEEGGQNE
jgi:predicted nuclease of restriction endonuclease-like (RecB) superfamily